MPNGERTRVASVVNDASEPARSDRALWAEGPSLSPGKPGVSGGPGPSTPDSVQSDDAARRTRRGLRYLARWKVRHFTEIKRLAGCGRWLNGSAEGRVIVKMQDGVGHFSGLQSCGSVWSCPACAAKIRQGRAVELEEAIGNWLAGGGGVEFVTLTVPHGARDELQGVFDLVADGWRKGVLSGRRFRSDRVAWGVPAWVRTVEVTLGQHGWHPHIHALLFTSKPWTPRQRALRGNVLFARWSSFVHRTTGRACSRDAFRIVGGALGAGAYITKVQESDAWRLGMEFTRGDLKTGRVQSLTPFELIAPAADGEAWAMHRWWEWEQVTRGRRCMSWSQGGRQVLGLDADEPTDQELVELEVGGDEVLNIPGEVWAKVVAIVGGEAGLLAAVEEGGPGAGSRFVSLLLRPAPPP